MTIEVRDSHGLKYAQVIRNAAITEPRSRFDSRHGNYNNIITFCTHLDRSGSANFSTAAGVVQTPDERPKEFNASGEHFTEVGQQYKEYRYAEYCVHDGDQPAGVRRRRYMTVT